MKSKLSAALSIVVLIAFALSIALLPLACKKSDQPKSLELTLGQVTAISADFLSTYAEAMDIALEEGLASKAERDRAFKELLPLLNDAGSLSVLLEQAGALDKKDADKWLSFLDRSARLFANLQHLQKLPAETRAKFAIGAEWFTRITGAARIVISAIQPAASEARAVGVEVKFAIGKGGLAEQKFTVSLAGLSAPSARGIDTAIPRLTSLGVDLIVRAIRLTKADIHTARAARVASFTALANRLSAAGF
jgi:hypothetical protein